jgi:hypothetical protein
MARKTWPVILTPVLRRSSRTDAYADPRTGEPRGHRESRYGRAKGRGGKTEPAEPGALVAPLDVTAPQLARHRIPNRPTTPFSRLFVGLETTMGWCCNEAIENPTSTAGVQTWGGTPPDPDVDWSTHTQRT